MALKISLFSCSTLIVCPVTSSLYFAKSTDTLKLESLLLVSNSVSPSSDNVYSGIILVKSSLISLLAEVTEDFISSSSSDFTVRSFNAASCKMVDFKSGMLSSLLMSSRISLLSLSTSIASGLLDVLDSLSSTGLLL